MRRIALKPCRYLTTYKRWNSTSITTDRTYHAFLKEIPRSVLDSAGSTKSIFRVQNNKNSVLINHLVQTLMRNDLERANILMRSLSKRLKSNPTELNYNLYLSSLNLYFTHLNSIGGINIDDLKHLIDESNEVFNKSGAEEIKYKAVICLVRSYLKLKDQTLTRYVSNYINKFIGDYEIDVSQLRNYLHSNDPSFMAAIAEITGIKTEDSGNKIFASGSIDNYKVNGMLSFERLCQYIETRFEKYDTDNHSPLYKVYDSLPISERSIFLEEYVRFNEMKQVDIENNCLNLNEDFSKLSMNDKRSLYKFKSHHADMLHNWYEKVSQSLTLISQGKFKDKSLSSEEACLLKYSSYLKLLPVTELTNMVIGVVFARLLRSDNNSVKIVELIRDLTSQYRFLVKNRHYRDIANVLTDIFQEEDSVSFFGAILSLVIKSCYFQMKTDSDRYGGHFSLLKEFTNSQDQFFEICDDGYPAFLSGISIQNGKSKFKKSGAMAIHPYLAEEFKTYSALYLSKSVYLPMLSFPKAWISPSEGGYLNDLKPLVSSEEQSTALLYLKEADRSGSLLPAFKCLDILSSTPWAINQAVLNVINQVANIKEGFLKIPPKVDHLIPMVAAKEFPEKQNYSCEKDYLRAVYKYKQDKKQNLQDYHASKCQRMEFEIFLRLANAFGKNGDIMFIPHNMDFRGRVYPMVSFLSHYQSDIVRSLLMFWEPKPLGESGFRWLKYHLAGLFGKDKWTLEERVRFIDESISLVVDSGKKPLDGLMWWKKADKPWQALSLCMEITNVLSYIEKGHNIEDYLCRIPIHLDGSCNGLQHYAALGADKEAAESVNVIPSEHQGLKFNDVYTQVLNLVVEEINHRVQKGELYAQLLSKILSRKLIKQTVMTSVYGVTRHGAMEQINERFKETIKDFQVMIKEGRPIPLTDQEFNNLRTNGYLMANYLADIVIQSISKLFSGAKKIQDWLMENCYRLITSYDLRLVEELRNQKGHDKFNFFDATFYKPMMWTSPTGFPVVQLYRDKAVKRIETPLQNISLKVSAKYNKINLRKQLNGIAPNFVHSIDATHMLLTCIESNRRGLSFSSVHDSFWTHPCDVDNLSYIIRDQFVKLYSTDLIEFSREDMKLNTEGCFQLAYLKKSENPDLAEKILQLRAGLIRGKRHQNKTDYNEILYSELKLQSQNRADETPLKLIEKYKPTVYFPQRPRSKILKPYYTLVLPNKHNENMGEDMIPVLVPVHILEAPPRGKLDLNQVYKSKYFFA